MNKNYYREQISKMSETEYNLITNRAATAIHLALTTFSSKGVFLVPSNICMSPIMAGRIANYEIEFIGTDLFQVDLMEVVKHLESDKNVKAILLPELYGYPLANLEFFWNYVKNKNILIIEDLAQSLGKSRISHFRGTPTVATIYSFGPTKIVDSIRCGIISTSNESFYQELKDQLALLETNSPTMFAETSTQYSNMYSELLRKDEADRDWPKFYTAASRLNPVLYTPRFELEIGADGFNFDEKSIMQTRNERHSRLLEMLRGFNQVKLPPDMELHHPVWRTTIRIDQKVRDLVVGELRYGNNPVSTWYKAMHRMFKTDQEASTQSLDEAVIFETEVINFFLDTPNFDQYFENVRSVITERLG
jgi:dTDP-4-amino-4,6-dideoxygalactose transaminase